MQQQKVVTKISKFIEFTPEQKERAATVDLEEFLLRQGEKLIKSGREKRLARDHSVTVRGCEWFDHASNEGGRAVSFVQKYYGKSYIEAMSIICDEVLERAREGKSSISDLIDIGSRIITEEDVMEGTPALVPIIQLEVMLPDGNKLVSIQDPIRLETREEAVPVSELITMNY